jgi:hypothetical protein
MIPAVISAIQCPRATPAGKAFSRPFSRLPVSELAGTRFRIQTRAHILTDRATRHSACDTEPAQPRESGSVPNHCRRRSAAPPSAINGTLHQPGSVQGNFQDACPITCGDSNIHQQLSLDRSDAESARMRTLCVVTTTCGLDRSRLLLKRSPLPVKTVVNMNQVRCGGLRFSAEVPRGSLKSGWTLGDLRTSRTAAPPDSQAESFSPVR